MRKTHLKFLFILRERWIHVFGILILYSHRGISQTKRLLCWQVGFLTSVSLPYLIKITAILLGVPLFRQTRLQAINFNEENPYFPQKTSVKFILLWNISQWIQYLIHDLVVYDIWLTKMMIKTQDWFIKHATC